MAGRCNENKGRVNSKLTLLTTGTSASLRSGFSRRPTRIGCRGCRREEKMLSAAASRSFSITYIQCCHVDCIFHFAAKIVSKWSPVLGKGRQHSAILYKKIECL
jgi:hypothetical protein